MEQEINDIWHVLSDGTRADIPFGTDEEKMLAWNGIAICAYDAGVSVLVITINDTHLHALVRGSEARAERFRFSLQHRLRLFNREETIVVDCQAVRTRTEALSKFMYVYRNCLDFYKKLPGVYPWGSGNIYFTERQEQGVALSEFSFREQYRFIRTKKALPQEWKIDGRGRILPESFIDTGFVEQLFGSVRAFIAFLYVRKEDEASMKREINHNYLEQRSIQDLRRIGNRYSVSICGRRLVSATLDVRLRVAGKMLKENLSGKSASLAKALFLKPEDLTWLV